MMGTIIIGLGALGFGIASALAGLVVGLSRQPDKIWLIISSACLVVAGLCAWDVLW